jgi:hypothetical protein
MTQYIYLLQTREFVNSKDPIYKIGKTTKLNFTRFKQYPQGSVLLFQSSCYDCNKLENEIIQLFKSKYKIKRTIGRESFEGDCHEMIKDLCDFIKNERIEITEKEVIKKDVEEEVVEREVVEREVVEREVVEEIVEEIVKDIVNEIVEETEKVIKDSEVMINAITIIEAQGIKKAKIDTNIEMIHDNENANENAFDNVNLKYCCLKCKYFTDTTNHLKQHLLTRKHLMDEQQDEKIRKHKCDKCDKAFVTKSGVWKHSQNCEAVKTIVPEPTTPDVDLFIEMNNLKRVMIAMRKNIKKTV